MKVATAIFLSAAVAPVSTSISPGLWEISSTSPLLPRSAPLRVCLKPEDVAKGPGLSLPSEMACEILKTEVAGGRFAYRKRCRATSSNDWITVTGSGTYSSSSYEGKVISVQKRGSSRIEMPAKVSGQRLGDC